MKILLFICLLGVAQGYIIDKQEQITDNGWQTWKLQHQKNYHDIYEEKVRYSIWQDNTRFIEEFNAKDRRTRLAMNHFGDMTNTEFRRMMNGYRMRNTSAGSSFLKPLNFKAPDVVDWRTKGYVTPVKNQGECGSCWAFSTTGSVEGQHFRATGKLVSLSEQNLVDCSKVFGNDGCNGGLVDYAFEYIKENNGIDTEDSYPYTAQEGTCNFNRDAVGATLSGYTDVYRNEVSLRDAVAANGPVSVAIDASHPSFQFYKSGVYYEPQCSSTTLDHGVLVVGYGSDNGEDYWLIKNSWGNGWGQEGYIWILRNYNNHCGVATQASYPLIYS